MDIICRWISSTQMISIYRWCPSSDLQSVTFSLSKNKAVGGGGSSASWNFSESSSILVSTGFPTIINFLIVLVRCDMSYVYKPFSFDCQKSARLFKPVSVRFHWGQVSFFLHICTTTHPAPTTHHPPPSTALKPKWVICGLAAWDLINLMPRLPPS